MSQYYARWVDGYQVIWRNLTKAEYNRFRLRYEGSRFEEPMSVALEIYELVHMKGPDPRNVPAGIAAYICKQQMIGNPFSGEYVDIANGLALARKAVASSYLKSATALIAATLNYKPEEIEDWDPNTFLIRLAQTEFASGRTLEPIDPKATTRGQRPQTKNKPPLTNVQRKALDRIRERDRGA